MIGMTHYRLMDESDSSFSTPGTNTSRSSDPCAKVSSTIPLSYQPSPSFSATTTSMVVPSSSKTATLQEIPPFPLPHLRISILTHDPTAVIDWELAGAYPLSALLSGGSVQVQELESDEDLEEDGIWGNQIRKYVEEIATERGWSEEDVDTLFRPNQALQVARIGMQPLYQQGSVEESESGESAGVVSAQGSEDGEVGGEISELE